MKTSNTSLLSFVFALLFSISRVTPALDTGEDFIQCLTLQSKNTTSISHLIYTPNNSLYASVLDFLIQNLRFETPTTPKPKVIVTPVDESQIQAVIYCSKKHALQIRVRSGGHDFEGASYMSEVPFVILDLFNMRSITVDVENATAWVQSGATLGEVYYKIAEKSTTLGFPAGYWSTVGVGGHFGGGGYGALLRKYGLAADNVIDARLIDVNGKILNRLSMGEDLFWAIRGGGHGNFGVITAWKINLVSVPEIVTVFKVNRTLEQNATKLVHRWQYVAPAIHEDLCIVLHTRVNSSQDGNRTILVSFESLFLGGVDRLLSLMEESFPELGLVKEDCTEMSWIESVVELADIFSIGASPDILLNRTAVPKQYTKQKADYVEEPISEDGLEGLWQVFYNLPAESAEMNWTPYGGRMSEISESATPYPHRAANLYMLYEAVYWDEDTTGPEIERLINWIRSGLYRYLTPYVSKNPRGAYANYRDYDLGVNNIGNTSYEQASNWGIKYFKENFNRLVQVKATVDPGNFFRNEQSIPPISPSSIIEVTGWIPGGNNKV